MNHVSGGISGKLIRVPTGLKVVLCSLRLRVGEVGVGDRNILGENIITVTQILWKQIDLLKKMIRIKRLIIKRKKKKKNLSAPE